MKPLQFLVCPDSFKDALPANRVADAISEAVKKVLPEAKIKKIPLADGGEGSLEALSVLSDTELIRHRAQDALHRETDCHYLIQNQQKALIELAQTAGLEKLAPGERNPLKTSTYGVGMQMAHARAKGVKNFVLFVGGSATNDGGAGLLQALGVDFYDKNGNGIKITGETLHKIARIDVRKLMKNWHNCRIEIASDVTNPLLGANGATYTYAVQKGAATADLTQLEAGLQHWSDFLSLQNPKFNPQTPGMGAAGGVAAGLSNFLEVTHASGFTTIAQLTDLEKHLIKADLIFTGEGSVDGQTLSGKTPLGVAGLAKKHHKPLVCLCGKKGDDLDALYESGITALFSITDRAMNLTEALNETPILLSKTTEDVLRLWLSNRKL